MTNETLNAFIEYAAELNEENHPASGFVFGPDIVKLWKVVGILAERVLTLETAKTIEDAANDPEVDLGGY